MRKARREGVSGTRDLKETKGHPTPRPFGARPSPNRSRMFPTSVTLELLNSGTPEFSGRVKRNAQKLACSRDAMRARGLRTTKRVSFPLAISRGKRSAERRIQPMSAPHNQMSPPDCARGAEAGH